MALWMGRGFAESVVIMNILLAGSLFQSQNLVAHVMLPGMGRLRVFTRIMLGYVACVLLLGCLFIKWWGLVGIAAAIAATMSLMEVIFMAYIFRDFEVTVWRFWRQCLMPSASAAVLPLVWIVAARAWLPATSWTRLSVDVACCLLLYVVGFWKWGLEASERANVMLKVFSGIGWSANRGEKESTPAAETGKP
jgi:O-antigen/teichoic acid export membrane protein